MSLTEHERETTINFSDGDGIARIYTAQRKLITKLKANPAVTLTEEGIFEGSPWARFTVPSELISFRSGKVKRDLTDEQRQEMAERMRRNLSKSPALPENTTPVS